MLSALLVVGTVSASIGLGLLLAKLLIAATLAVIPPLSRSIGPRQG